MAVKLEIGLKAHLFDAEGASLCKKIRDYFGWEIREARVIHVLTLDADLSDREMEIIRRDIFTNPVTQESSFETLAADFDWAIWVGFRPGVRDTAGSVAIEAISDTLGRTLGPRESAYTSKLFLLRGSSLEKWQAETVARELLANDIIQQWRIAHLLNGTRERASGSSCPRFFWPTNPPLPRFPFPPTTPLPSSAGSAISP